jgi:hypothetical protein
LTEVHHVRHSDYQTIVADIKEVSAGGKTAVKLIDQPSVGDSQRSALQELGAAGLKAKRMCRLWRFGRQRKKGCAVIWMPEPLRVEPPGGTGTYFEVDQGPDQRAVSSKKWSTMQSQNLHQARMQTR